MPDGVRLGSAYFELTADSAPLTRAMVQAEQQTKRSTAGITQSTAAASQQASRGFSSMAKSAAAFGAGMVGIGSAVSIANAALQSIVENTQKAAQAQFNLAATYRTSAASIQVFATAQAAATKQTVTDVQNAASAFGSLNLRYAINLEQVKELTKRSADLAAVKGISVVDAAKRLEAALRGEAESAEFLGLTLNSDYLKKFADMTAEQRKNWETLDPLIKAQITYREALKQTDQFLGAATKRATENAGAMDRMTAAGSTLAASIGKELIPELNGLATATEKATGWLDELIKKALEAARNISRGQFLPPGPGGPIQIGPDAGMPGAGTPTPAQLDALDAGRKAALLAEAERRDQAKRDLDAADKANKAAVESAIKAIDAERRAKAQWYDEEKQRIEARRTYQLEDIETRKQAALDALAAEKQAALDAIDAQIEQQNREKQARLDAADAAADAAKAAIDAHKQQLALDREDEDRARADRRQSEDRTREDARRAEDRTRDHAQKDELKRLDELKDARTEAIQGEIELVEKASQRRLRALDREADRARAASEQALARLERQGEAEDEAHRKRMQALEDEQDARLDILDAQLKALDAEEKSADAAQRTADLQKRLAAATLAKQRATGTGTPEEVATAREELTRALRGTDELSIANARERLLQLAGQGNEAIQKADEDLAAAQQDLRDQGVDAARDAEKEKIAAAKEAITDEIDARKRAEDDADRARKLDLERDQEAQRGKLQATLGRIEKQKQAEQDTANGTKKALQQDLQDAQKAADEQVRITRLRFEQEGQLLEDARREEDRLRTDSREAEDRVREDARRAQDADLARQLAAIASTLEAERKETEAHYNGPNGIITQLKAAREAAEREYAARLIAVTRSYEAERHAAELKYHNPEGTGELDLLDKQRTAEMQALADRKTEYEEQGKAFHQMILDMLADIDAFIAKQQSIPTFPSGGGSSGGGGGGGGGGGSASAASTGSGGLTIANVDEQTVLKGIQKYFSYSTQAAADAVEVWSGEGRSGYVGDHGTSFGPFQLHTPGGLGDSFKKETGEDPRDPKTVLEQIAWVANYVRNHGWNDQWHGAPGYPGHGISVRKYDAGGMLREPVLGRGLRSGRPYSIAEYGPEYIMSRRATSAMLGGGAGSASAGMGAFLAAAHPGGAGGGSYVEGDINVSGIGLAEVASEIERRQHRQHLLRGLRGNGRR